MWEFLINLRRGLRLEFIPNLSPKSLFLVNFTGIMWLFWDLGLMLFDISKDLFFPKILLFYNIFDFPAVSCSQNGQNCKLCVCSIWVKIQNFEGFFWSKLIAKIYLNKVFHLTKSWGVKMSLKISFLAQFRSFLKDTIKAYIGYVLCCSRLHFK